MTKYIYVVVLMIVLTNCVHLDLNESFYPIKVYQKKTYRMVETLILYGDSTFKYKCGDGFYEKNSEGTWKEHNFHIMLNSYKLDKKYFNIISLDNFSKKDSICIYVLQNGFLQSGIAVHFLGTNQLSSSDVNGKIVLKKVVCDSIQLGCFNYLINQPCPKNIRGDIVINLNLAYNRVYFRNEKWIRQGKTLISPKGNVFKMVKIK